jgi:hypothetical protein
MSDHHATLSPSSLPALDKCPQFKSGPVGEAAEEGTRQHQQLSMLYDGLDPESNGTPPTLWAWQWVQDNMNGHTLKNEYRLSLLRDFEEVTFGTADFIGYDNLGRLTAIDYKSGQQRDYYYQLVTYALAAMQKYGDRECRIVTLYGKTETAHNFVIQMEDAENAVFGLLDRLAAGGPSRLCDYCSWCENNGSCDATAPAITAVATAYPDEPLDIKDIETWHASEITDPVQMAKVYEVACAVEKWADSAKHHIKQKAIEGVDIPGYRLRAGAKKRTIDEGMIQQAFEVSGLTDAEFLACCSVAVGKIQKAIGAKEDMKGKALKDEVNRRLESVIYLKENAPSLVREKRK